MFVKRLNKMNCRNYYPFITGQIVCLTLIFCACQNKNNISGNEGSKDLGKVASSQINFIGHWKGEGKKEKLLLEFINEFEFVNQDLKVNMKFPEEIYFDRRKFNIEIEFNAKIAKSQNPQWDIIRLNNEYFKVADSLKDPDWAKKYLVDFSQIPEFKKSTRPELLSDTVKAKYGGIIPGPFIDGYNWTMWCNVEVAKKIGIEVKQFDMTNEDFYNYIKAVYEYNKSHNDTIMALYEAWNWQTSKTLAQEYFFSELNDYDALLNFRYSEKKINAWFKVLREMERLSVYKPLPNWKYISWTETVNYPLNGKCLFYANGSWMYNIWLKNDSVKLKNMMPTEMPVFKPTKVCFGGYFATWAVLKKAPHRENAVRLLLALNNPDVAEKWARYTKSPTGIKGNLTTYNFGFDKLENYQYMIEQKYGHNKVDVYNDSRFCLGTGNEAILDYSVEVLSGIYTAEQAIQKIKKNLITK
jgi:hypothetical protein